MTLSRRTLYALMAALLSAGAPLGLLLLRFMGAGTPTLAWLRSEVGGDALTYLYVSISTAIAFSLFGHALGCQADRLLELSETDPLTGLANARLLQQRLGHELARAARYGTPVSILQVDLDGLKEINDRFGHRAGDLALRLLAEAIRSELRAADLGARCGGDEFALLAPNTSREAAAALAERVRALVAANSGAGDAPTITASVGVATFDPSKAGLPASSDLMRAADEALYEAKRSGRNRVRVAAQG